MDWCRARDKKKNIAGEKAQAQKRLLRASNREGQKKSDHQRRKEMLERRREELVKYIAFILDICTCLSTVFGNFMCFTRAAISAPGASLSCSSRLDARVVSLLDVL